LVFPTEIEAKRVLRVTPDGKIKVVAETDAVPAYLRGGSIQRIGAIPVAVGRLSPIRDTPDEECAPGPSCRILRGPCVIRGRRLRRGPILALGA
jgi:hypothetical protein